MVSLSFFWLNETLVRKYTNVEYFTLAKINLKKAKTHQLTVRNYGLEMGFWPPVHLTNHFKALKLHMPLRRIPLDYSP